MRPYRHNDERGFTLLEVLLSVAILAIALPVLLGLRNFDLELQSRSMEITTATLLAQEKLLETELAGSFPIGESTGEFQTPAPGVLASITETNRAPGYRWKRSIMPTPLELIREVKIQISWPRGQQDETLEVSTYVFAGLAF
ncbi:MAG: prepilin-type N-terminal cleavage/methylation domain-containing protein [Nitrospira sp.]|nr:prepilin-type N-terminal cleavage/methylation domain-containing protein [Nitrospira sp.]